MQTIEQQREIFLNMSREVLKDSPTYFRVTVKWLVHKHSEPFKDDETIHSIAMWEDCRIFLTYNDAETSVRLTDRRKNSSLYSILIDEMKDGASLYWDRPIQSWLYDGMGVLVDHNINENYGFFGILEENRRFRIGDIVKTIWHDYKMRIGIVVGVPKTPVEAWKDASALATLTKREIVNGLHPDENGYDIYYADNEFENIVTEHPLNLMLYTNPTAQQKDKLFPLLDAYNRNLKKNNMNACSISEFRMMLESISKLPKF